MPTPAHAPVTVLATPTALPRLTVWLGKAGYPVHDRAPEEAPWPEGQEVVDTAHGGHLSSETRPCGHAHCRGHQLSECHPSAPSALWDDTGGTLVTYLPANTRDVVTPALLARLPPPALWLQLAPMALEDAHGLARRARAVGVTMLHAPYLQAPDRYALPADPSARDRPTAVVFGPVTVTGRGRADALVRALCWEAYWAGPLEAEAECPCLQELCGPGDHALEHIVHPCCP